MELRIISPSEDGFIKKIEWNHEEIKTELALRLAKYRGLVYSEDEIKSAKSDRATLNKFKDAIDAKRKEIKLQCMIPYENFELKVKEILALVEEPISEIDTQIKSYEEKQKDEKRLIIEGVYAENIDNLTEILPLKRIWNEKWLNTTYKLNTVSQEIIEAIEKTRADLEVIGNLGSEFDLQVKDKYLQTLDLSLALKEKTRLEEQKAKMESFKAEEEKRKQLEADAKAKAEKERAEKVSQKQAEINPSKVIEFPNEIVHQDVTEQVFNQEPQLEEIIFKVWVTVEQKQLLKNFVKENKIKIGKVEV